MITRSLTADLVLGAMELENTDMGLRPHRLPRWVRDRYADAQLAMMEAQPSGTRVAFVTKARSFELDVHAARVAYQGMKRARGALDVFIDGKYLQSHQLSYGDFTELDFRTGTGVMTTGADDHVVVEGLAGAEKHVEVWLPHNEQVDLVALSADAPISTAPRNGPLWLHHGSSISQGSNATNPSATWPAVAARTAGARLHNLGFGGSALVDPFMARVIRDAPAEVISLKLGINVVNLDAMRLRSFVPAVEGFIDTIRDGHPHTPLLLVSPIFCGIHENTPGPGAVDPSTLGTDFVKFIASGNGGDLSLGRLTLRVIRDALEQVAEARADDPNLHYLDGLDLYGENDAEGMPLPDGLHPDTATHALIGERFAHIAFGEEGPFASAGRG